MSKRSAKLRSKCQPIQYQVIERRRPNVITLHGEKISDYYDWLKNESERKNWILKNENYTLTKYLDLNSQKNDWTEIRKIFHNPIDYELFSDVQLLNGYIFYSNRDFSNQSTYKSIFKRVKSLKDERPHIVFNSNKIQHGSVTEHEYSPNAKYCAFTISDKSQNSIEVVVIDVESGETCGNRLQLFNFERIAWSGDSLGFFIYYDPEGRKRRQLYYHYLDEHKPDKLIAKIRKSEAHELSFQVSFDYKYLILRGSRMLCIANIETLEENIKFKLIFEIFADASYDYVGNDGDFFLFLTNVGAPKHHLIEIDIRNKRPRNNFDIVVAENLDGRGVLKSTFKYSGFLFLNYIEKAQSSMYIYSISDQCIEYKIDFKDEQVVSSKIDKFGVFFETRSFKTPRKVYRIEFNQLLYRERYETTYSTIEPVLWKESRIPNLDELEITVQYDTYFSFDGTEIPMTIIQKKQNDCYRKPCLVYAYGGFGDCLLPRFDLYFLLFVELFNGVVVFIHIRGGGELGDGWLLKPTEAERSFCDLVFGVEYLKGESYADIIDSNKIAFYGTSHGALTGAVAMNIKQDLFSAVILLNGNMDLINDLPHKGRLWAKQYGSLNNKDDFDCIKRYAPLLHVQQPTKTSSYPPTLIVASKKDEVVPITNSLKYLAHRRRAARDTQYQIEKPVLLKIIHSGGNNYRTAEKTEYINTVFIKLEFLAEAMELKLDKNYETNQICKSFMEIMNCWFPEPPIKYQIIEQRAPKVIALHREKILDYYDWLKEKCHWNEILQTEGATLQKYLELNSSKNNWPEIKEIFGNSVDYEMYRDVQHVNGYIFYSYVNFSRSINKPIYRRVKTLDEAIYGRPREIFNSNRTLGAFVEHAYSPNGEFCAFTISSEKLINSHKVMVIDVRTGRQHGKCLPLFSCKKIAWSGDSLGFFIYYDPEGRKKRHLYYHYLDGDKPDKLMAKIPKFDANTVSFIVSSDYKHLILRGSRKLSIAYINSLDRDIKFDLIFKFSPDITYDYVGNHGEFFYFLTNFEAPKHHVIEVNIRSKVNMWNVDVVVPENLHGHGVLVAAQKYCNYLYLIYIENVQNSMYLYSLTSRRIEYKIDLEDETYVTMNIDPSGFFLETQSFKTPRKIYRVNFDQLVLQRTSIASTSIVLPMLWKESKIAHLNVAKFKVRHDSFQSFDKIKVPMTFIQKDNGCDAYKKPCLVFAYGGYGIPMTPLFKLFFLLFIELFNGIVVFIHIRGGGELGDKWVLKPTEAETSFKDLMAGVEYLKGESYAHMINPNKIAFYGASHGGLVGAVVMNIHRDLFRATILQNGNMDLINDLPHKGRIWAKQYGNLNNKDDFDCIKRYAPLLHIQRPTKPSESYPTTLIVASRYDEIVSIANSIKYLAHRREKEEINEFYQDKPTLMKVLNSGGHHYETAKKYEIIDAIFVKLQFLAESMDIKCDKIYRKKHSEQKQNI
ncbi:uncharacterized protein LOC129571737 [Sitodiplosis mosellana]|uniref:uncharacterized protein LOC129571737 n=1 Tax=Sitodiplosis mosellana TaxID=263140 RepID=UPI002444AE05|nr:uncharacterized protein LOC129571737 [Sitodiplosis mosellana]